MTKGMLWQLDDPNASLSAQIRKAADYHEKKYGRRPDLCLVHPNMLNSEKLDVEGITVRPWRSVLPGHLIVGVEEKPTNPKESRPT